MSASLVGLLLLGVAEGGETSRRFEYQQVHMGLPVRILLHASDRRTAETAARNGFSRIAALDRMMSDYRPDSEVRKLEAAGGAWTAVSPELVDVLSTALEVAGATEGAFDPTVGPLVALWRQARRTATLPAAAALEDARALVNWRHVEIDGDRRTVRFVQSGMRLDLGGIAKGYILQQALESVRAAGIRRAMIESGGDIVVGAAPPGAPGWRIDAPGADEPFRRRAAALTDMAVATSGHGAQFVEIDGVRYSHVVDPRTGMGVRHQATARVIAADGALADALATALAIAGPEGAPPILARFPNVRVSLSDR